MNYTNYVSLEIDDFILDKDSSIWIASLSNGEVAHQDDDRPNCDSSSWHRLQNYCYDNNIYITNIALKFRTHTEVVGSSNEGYFFIKSVLGSLSQGKSKTFHYYKLGFVQSGFLLVQKWKIPELILENTEERCFHEDVVKKCMIWNNVKEKRKNRKKKIQLEI